MQLTILALIGFLANSWVSANETGLRRSQYSHKPSDSSRVENMQADRHENPEKQPGWFARLGALLKPIIHRD